jgi:hypothetical protein
MTYEMDLISGHEECMNCGHDYESHLELGGCKGNNKNAPRTLRDLIEVPAKNKK